jgi:uncharacterized protein (DUF362 family)
MVGSQLREILYEHGVRTNPKLVSALIEFVYDQRAEVIGSMEDKMKDIHSGMIDAWHDIQRDKELVKSPEQA